MYSKCIYCGWWWGLWGCEGLVLSRECWLQWLALTASVSNYDDTATLWALRKWTRFILRSVMEMAASHHTDPDNDQARYRYKEIPGILLAFIIHLSCSHQAATNKPSSTALISSPRKSAYNALFWVRVEHSNGEESFSPALLVSLLMPDNAGATQN